MRQHLPHPKLPHDLDPRHVHIDDPLDLPLCWFGIRFHPKQALELAIELDLAVRNTTGRREYDCFWTFNKLRASFKEETGLSIGLQQVWSPNGGEISILAFYSNREYESITMDKFRLAYGLLEMMKFPEDKMLMRWYPDINETVCRVADDIAGVVAHFIDSAEARYVYMLYDNVNVLVVCMHVSVDGPLRVGCMHYYA